MIRALGGSSLYVTSSLLGRGLNVAAAIYVYSAFDLRDAGEFAFVQTTAITFATILTSPLATWLNAKGSDHEGQSFSRLLSFCVVASLIFSFCIVTIFIAAQFFGAVSFPKISSLVVSALSAALFGSGAIFQALNISQGRLAVAGTANFCSGGVLALTAMTLNHFGKGPDTAILVSFAASLLIQVAPLALYHTRKVTRHDAHLFWTNSRQDVTKFYSANMAALVLANASAWLLPMLLIKSGDASQNAWFSLGTQLLNVSLLVPTMLAPIAIRHFSKHRVSLRWISTLSAILLALGLSIPAIGYGIFENFDHAIPERYLLARASIEYAAICGALLVARVPIQAYAQSKLWTLPDFFASAVFCISTVSGCFLTSDIDALAASQIRLISYLLYTITMFVLVAALARVGNKVAVAAKKSADP